jgi:hypothetical protein
LMQLPINRSEPLSLRPKPNIHDVGTALELVSRKADHWSSLVNAVINRPTVSDWGWIWDGLRVTSPIQFECLMTDLIWGKKHQLKDRAAWHQQLESDCFPGVCACTWPAAEIVSLNVLGRATHGTEIKAHSLAHWKFICWTAYWDHYERESGGLNARMASIRWF